MIIVVRDHNPRFAYIKHTSPDGLCHRIDGPTYEYLDGQKEWWINGKRHRVDGPAIENPNGRIEHWEHGYLIKVLFTISIK